MQTEATTSRMLEFDGMHGDAWVQKVTDALMGTQNVKTVSVKTGTGGLEADNPGRAAACSPFVAASFTAHEKLDVSTSPLTPANIARTQSSGRQHGNHAEPAKTGAALKSNWSMVHTTLRATSAATKLR